MSFARGLRLTMGALAVAGAVMAGAVVACSSTPSAPVAAAPTSSPAPTTSSEPAPSSSPSPTASPEPVLRVRRPAGDLPVVDYGPAPRGFPADPDPYRASRVAEGLRPTRPVAAYNAAGGRAIAWLPTAISGVDIVLPIVDRRSGWVAVLMPSTNRTVAWVPPGDWTTVPLRDHLVVDRRGHTLTWFRDDVAVRSWPVSLGIPATPTPLGRTFILGRTTLPGEVYADTDVFALGAVPDDPDAVPSGLRGAHIGLHTWYNDDTLGEDDTDGCIRLTRSGQELLLRTLKPGTLIVVLDQPFTQ